MADPVLNPPEQTPPAVPPVQAVPPAVPLVLVPSLQVTPDIPVGTPPNEPGAPAWALTQAQIDFIRDKVIYFVPAIKAWWPLILSALIATGIVSGGAVHIVHTAKQPPAIEKKEPDKKEEKKKDIGKKVNVDLVTLQTSYGRGRIAPSQATLFARHSAAFARHGYRMMSLPKSSIAEFDWRSFGFVPPIKNQASCGSCYQFSGADICEMAFMKAGVMSVNSGGLAEQYGMDCQQWGGCGGGDEWNVIDWCQKNGIPSTADYGPFTAGSGPCQLKAGTKMWKIDDYGFCTPSQQQGIASVQDIKNAMVLYGPISVAVDAAAFNSYSGGVMRGSGSNVDHAVILVGWKDDYWIGRNQWGTDWGEQGYFKIAYDAYSIGTEALWATVAALPVPPGPGPTPPPPGPDPTPTPVPVPDPCPKGTIAVATPIVTGDSVAVSWTLPANDARQTFVAISQYKDRIDPNILAPWRVTRGTSSATISLSQTWTGSYYAHLMDGNTIIASVPFTVSQVSQTKSK